MATCSYNCTALPEHERITCGAYRKGGISEIAILECDHGITDFDDEAQIIDALAAEKITMIKGIKAEFPEPTPVEGESPVGCGPATILDGFDWTVTWEDHNVSQTTIDFYNALNERSAGVMIYYCEDNEFQVIDKPCSFVAKHFAPMSNKANRKFVVEAKFSTAPDGIPPLHGNATNSIFGQ
jgi:hypothetical protein